MHGLCSSRFLKQVTNKALDGTYISKDVTKGKLRTVQYTHTDGTEILHLLSKTIINDELQTYNQH